MCTRVLWNRSGRPILVGRNMDWRSELGTNLWVMPRGVERAGMADDPHPLIWTSRHGSVIASAFDAASTDGMNEQGLAGHILWLAECDFGARDAELPALSASLWLQYFLDSCSTVAECLEAMDRHPFQVRSQEMQGTAGATIHLALDDASGDSAVIEYLDGRPRVHHDRSDTVLTNSPTFDKQLRLRSEYAGFGGDRPLPGSTTPTDRFVRASYYLQQLPDTDDVDHAYAALLSVLRNVGQPFGTQVAGQPNSSATIWRTLADLTAGIYAFESVFRPNIVWTRLADLDFTGSARLDLTRHDLVGDVTSQYAPAAGFAFASA